MRQEGNGMMVVGGCPRPPTTGELVHVDVHQPQNNLGGNEKGAVIK